LALPARTTFPVTVVRVVAWKIQTAFGSPLASSVRGNEDIEKVPEGVL